LIAKFYDEECDKILELDGDLRLLKDDDDKDKDWKEEEIEHVTYNCNKKRMKEIVDYASSTKKKNIRSLSSIQSKFSKYEVPNKNQVYRFDRYLKNDG